jgi:hypothetical protein
MSFAGDGGLGDATLQCLAVGVPPRELAALAAETLALCHGQDDDEFGPSAGRRRGAKFAPTGRGSAAPGGGALSAAAAASRELLLAALLRTPPDKVSKGSRTGLCPAA